MCGVTYGNRWLLTRYRVGSLVGYSTSEKLIYFDDDKIFFSEMLLLMVSKTHIDCLCSAENCDR